MLSKTPQEELEIFANEIANVVKNQFNFRDLILLTIISIVAVCLIVLSYKQGRSDASILYLNRDVEHLKYPPVKDTIPEELPDGIDISTFEVTSVKNKHRLHYVYYKKLDRYKEEYYTVITKN
jgi:hypothetical protein